MRNIEYTVQQGDTLSLIGLRYGVPWQTLRDINMPQGRIQSGNPDILWYNNGIRRADVLLIPQPDLVPTPAPQPSVSVSDVISDAIDSIPVYEDEDSIPMPTNQPGVIPDSDYMPATQEVADTEESDSKMKWIIGAGIFLFIFRKKIFGGK